MPIVLNARHCPALSNRQVSLHLILVFFRKKELETETYCIVVKRLFFLGDVGRDVRVAAEKIGCPRLHSIQGLDPWPRLSPRHSQISSQEHGKNYLEPSNGPETVVKTRKAAALIVYTFKVSNGKKDRRYTTEDELCARRVELCVLRP